MNWEAIGAVGEILGALAVVLTLIYLAIQVRHAKNASVDINRLERSKGVRDMLMASALNDGLRETLTKALTGTEYYEDIASKLDLTIDQAARFDWAMDYWFWLHWGQFASSTIESDLDELRNVVSVFYRHPNVRICWENSPWAKPVLEKKFVEWVEDILAADPE